MKRTRLVKDRIHKESKFWNLYAGKYDDFLQRSPSRSSRILSEKFLEDTIHTKNLLEIGTGPGIFSLMLSRHIPKITGIDLSSEMIKIAEKHRVARAVENITFLVGDACSLEFEDSTFDTIIASSVLHLLFEPGMALQEMRRVLKNGGKIIIPTYCHGSHFKSHILSRFMTFYGFKVRSRWSLSSFRTFVEGHGFKIDKESQIEGSIPMSYLAGIKEF